MAKPKGAVTKNPKIQDARIRAVFNEVMGAINRGEKPNVFAIQKAYGYSDSSARSYMVTQTKTWQKCLEDIRDDKVIERWNTILEKGSDRDAISVGREFLTLKRRYPNQSETKITFQRKINLLMEQEENEKEKE